MNFKYISVSFVLIIFAIAFLLQNSPTKLSGSHTNDPTYFRKLNRIKSGLPKSGKPDEATKWFYEQRVYPGNQIPFGWRENAFSHINKHNLSKSLKPTVSWNSVGPFNVGGRVRAIAIANVDPNIVYASSVSGGIFKSTTGGSAWTPTSDQAANLAVSSIVIDPTNNNIIYAGTGEGFFNYDAIRGEGVLKSTDAGASWTILKNFSGPLGYPYYINDLYLRSDSVNILYAASNYGLFKTTNSGSSWFYIHQGSSSTRATQIVSDPTNPLTFFVCYGNHTQDGIYKTTNGGTSFSKLTSGFPVNGYNRIALTISKSNPTILYASLDSTSHYTHSIQKSTDGGATWFAVGKPIDPQLGGSHLGGQGWYNNVIAVHPTDPNIVFAAGINLFKSTNGGTNWTMIAFGYSGTSYPYVHVDHHEIEFHPTNPSIMYFGNDGGVFKTTNGGTSFSELNNGFATTQFYSGSIHPTQEVYYGGTQDNGTLKSGTIPNWSMVFGGDGGATAVDYNTPSNVYTEYVELCLMKSTSSGAVNSWFKSMTGIPAGPNTYDGTTDRVLFIAPYVMDPTSSGTLVAGTYKVYRTTNGAALWTSISGDLTGDGTGATGSKISAIAIAKSSSATIYIGTTGGTASSRVQVTTNTGTTWSLISQSPLPNRWVTSIAIDPTNASNVWVGYSGYNFNTPTTPGHIFHSTNAGTNWTDVSGDLPDVPVNTIILDPASLSHILVGTDLGVFETQNSGTNWVQQNNGMANVVVMDMDLRADGYVFAATHGRGMFKTLLPLYSGPSFSYLPKTINFGSIAINNFKEEQIIVRNIGDQTLAISYAFSTNTNFSILPTSGSIQPNDSICFKVKFSPSVTGQQNGYIIFNHNAKGSTDSVQVMGSGISYLYSPSNLDFGQVFVDTIKHDKIKLVNLSSQVMIVNNIFSTNTVFTITPANATIPANDSITFDIVFSPTIQGVAQGNIQVDHNFFGSPIIIPARGIGLAYKIVPDTLDFGNVGTGLSITKQIKINNFSNDTMYISSITSTRTTFSSLRESATIQPKDSLEISIVFSPIFLGLDSGSIIFVHNFETSSSRILVIGQGTITIYPGDTNNDGIVDSRDLLPIARYYGNQGSTRSNPSINWIPQTLTGTFSPIAAAYADCNGNGTVEKSDVLALIQNWARSVGSFSPPVLNAASVCEELLNSMSDIPTSGVVKEIRNEIVRYRSQLLGIPNEWILEQNYPNPFNPSTKIKFNLPVEVQSLQLIIYDMNGRIVRELEKQNLLPGFGSFDWDGTNEENLKISSGVYLYTMKADRMQFTKKMVLIK